MKTSLGVADFLDRFGIRRELISIIGDATRLTGDSSWHVIGSTWRSRHAPKSSPFDASSQRHLVSADAVRDDISNYVQHPWVREMRHLPQGKSLQITLLAELLNRHRPQLGLEYEGQRHPFLSQPLIEVCLRIPLYLLLKGGRTRSLARDAFHDVLPNEIVERCGKGRTTSYVMGLFRRSQPFIQELILHGELARHDILDRPAVEGVLENDRPLRPVDLFPLLSCIAAEVFARSWSDGSRVPRLLRRESSLSPAVGIASEPLRT